MVYVKIYDSEMQLCGVAAFEQSESDIKALIPEGTTVLNPLVNMSFVTTAIATSTATFRGTYETLAELQAVTDADDNDYGYVEDVDEYGNMFYKRYKFNGEEWEYEFSLSNTQFNQSQWGAINSGVTSDDITKLSTLPTSSELTVLLNDKQDAIGDLQTIRNQAANAAPQDTTYTKTEVNNLITTPNQEYVSVIATSQTTSVTDVLPATGAADTTYRVGNWDGTQYNDSVFSEYAWNGSAYIKLSTKSQIGEVYDISANHADTKYADLTAALGTNGANIPDTLRKGGMSVKFVQSSDNKYVQWRLMSNTWSIIVSDWQNINTIPTTIISDCIKKDFYSAINHINRFNKNDIIAGKRIDGNGDWIESADFFTTQKIYVGDLTSVMFSYSLFVSFFDADGNFISQSTINSYNEDKTVSLPAGTWYLQVSTYNTAIDTLQIGSSVSRTSYVEYNATNLSQTIEKNSYEIDELKKSQIQFINRFNKNDVVSGKYLTPGGGEAVNPDFSASKMIYVGDLTSIVLSYTFRSSFYNDDGSWNSDSAIQNTESADAEIAIPANAKYIRVCCRNSNLGLVQVGKSVNRANYVEYGVIDVSYETIKPGMIETFKNESVLPIQQFINRFDKNSSDNVLGKYMPNGTLIDNEYYFVSHFIDISLITGKLSVFCAHFVNFFDVNGTYISTINMSPNWDIYDKSVDIPSGAKYVRISAKTDYLGVVQVGRDVSRFRYKDYGKYSLPNSILKQDYVTVDVNGNGNYTSLLEALMSTDKDIVVKAGIYDIVAEYKAKFGNDYYENYGNYIQAAGNFAHGLYVSERSLVFEGNAKLEYDLTNIDVSYTDPAGGSGDRRFSAIMVGTNAIIKNMRLKTWHNWYSIHDDGNPIGFPYANTNIFENCYVIGHDMVNVNVIGGGVGMLSTTIIRNCYFDNCINSVDTRTIRYHNTPKDGAMAKVIITDTYVNGTIFIGHYGTQTSKALAMISNCSLASAIDLSKQAPLEPDETENFELVEWNNTIR